MNCLNIRRLHIGGLERKEGWEVLNIFPSDVVDHVGNARDLSRFKDATFHELYASHVLEHLSGLNREFLAMFLHQAGFATPLTVSSFNLFNDTSTLTFAGIPISLNMIAKKPC